MNDLCQHCELKAKPVLKNAETIEETFKARKALDDHLDAGVKHQRLYEVVSSNSAEISSLY